MAGAAGFVTPEPRLAIPARPGAAGRGALNKRFAAPWAASSNWPGYQLASQRQLLRSLFT